jgi:hypothetical protein
MKVLVLWTIFNSFIIGFKFQSNSTISSSTKKDATSNTFPSTSTALICVFVIAFFLILLIIAIVIKRKKIRSYFIQKCRKEVKNTSTSKQNVGMYLTQFENEYKNEKPTYNNNNQYDVINSINLSHGCKKEIKNTSTPKQNVGMNLKQFENEDQNEKPNNNNQYDEINSIILSPQNLTIDDEEHVYDYISNIQTSDFYDSLF